MSKALKAEELAAKFQEELHDFISNEGPYTSADIDRFSSMDIDYGDGPNDFCDAYVISGMIDGRDLTEEEVEELNTECHTLLYDLIIKNYY